ncbi:helix-turn-helix domain-containing protein [Lentzea indica]|nr:helix-turn-helix domain-containing protein [Lentzea indica]
MGAVEALSNPSTAVQRLLDLAKTWSDTPNGAGPSPPPAPFKTLRKLKPHELDELVERYQAGSSVYQLAKHYGIHRITIGRLLRSRGIDTTAPALTEEQAREAARLYADGWSCKKIARHLGAGAETVRERLHEEGVPMRGPHERIQKR